MRSEGKRHYRADEEPESETIQDWTLMAEGCRYCGGEDHELSECLTRPLSDWVKS